MAADRAARSARTNVVVPLSTFVGRAQAIAGLSRLFEDGERLVTLLGGPGVGKTRLSLQFAAENVPSGGAWFCDLTHARETADVCLAVSAALSSLLPSTSTEAMIDAIGERLQNGGDVLLVLDNFEQLVGTAAEAVARWCAAAPSARILVTSRERLRVVGEHVVEIEPLDEEPAVALFQQRARASRGGTQPVDAVAGFDEATVRTLVRALDGIPLAIELAAARSRVFTPTEIVDRLRLDLLASQNSRTPRRHATMRDAIEWSWTSLGESEQSVLAQCSVFAEGFDLAAAERVVSLRAFSPEPAVLDVIESLRDKCLLRATADARTGETRFSMFASVREYVAEKLAASGLEDAARRRHLEHYLDIGLRLSSACRVYGDPRAHAVLVAERGNLLAAYRHAIAEGPDQAVVGAVLCLAPLLTSRGPFGELFALAEAAFTRAEAVPSTLSVEARLLQAEVLGVGGFNKESIAELEALLPHAGSPVFEGRALVSLGTRLRQLGMSDRAWTTHVRAQACLEGSGTRPEALSLASLGRLHADFGRPTEGYQFDARARVLASKLGDHWVEGMAIGNMAQLDQEQGRWDDARAHYERAVELFRAAGDVRFIAIYGGHVGDLEYELSALPASASIYRRSSADLSRYRIPRGEGLFRAALGSVLAQLGDHDEAMLEIARAEALLSSTHDPFYARIAAVHGMHVALCRGTTSADDVERWLAETVPSAPTSLDLRFALRMLRRRLSEAKADVGASLSVSRDGSRCRIGAGPELDLRRKGAIRRILLALIEKHRASPGTALGTHELLGVGWPNERILPDAGSKRVRVAIAALRRMGLERRLVTDDDGYLLDPRIVITTLDETPA